MDAGSVAPQSKSIWLSRAFGTAPASVRYNPTQVKQQPAMAARHQDLLSVDSTAAFVVDVQEAFRPHIHEFDAMVAAIRLLVAGCNEVGVPVAASEQYPSGLGKTVDEVAQALPDDAPLFDKMEISSVAAAGWASLPDDFRGREAVLVCGIETHVCVNQTVHDLLAAGKRVHVVADAVGSRDPWQREVALERFVHAGAIVTTVEMALFELLDCAGTDRFKAVQRLIKAYDAERREREARDVQAAAQLGLEVEA